ncbi:MAG: hypothetical protein J5510_01535, partial [Prevotella sp.]|nr:hypothetical protein [Prevotella sp.]
PTGEVGGTSCSAQKAGTEIPIKHKPMKYHGCILEFTDQRNEELMRAFRMAIDKSDFIDIAEISEMVVNTPCSRFWVSEERAMVVVAAMLKGKPVLNFMRQTKREMFKEIFARVITLRKEHPKAKLFELVMKVVNSPAPKFYMRPRCAMEIIYKIKKKSRY